MDGYFIYLKSDDTDIIVRLRNQFDWFVDYIRGDEDLIYYIQLDNHYDFDDVMDALLDEFDYVEEIDPSDIDDYIKN